MNTQRVCFSSLWQGAHLVVSNTVLHLENRFARNPDDEVRAVGVLFVRDLKVFIIFLSYLEASDIRFVIPEAGKLLLYTDSHVTISFLFGITKVNRGLILALGRKRLKRNHLLDGHTLAEVIKGLPFCFEVGKRTAAGSIAEIFLYFVCFRPEQCFTEYSQNTLLYDYRGQQLDLLSFNEEVEA